MTEYKINTKIFTPLEQHTYLIGIDTGVKTGVSIYDTTVSKFDFCKCFEWWDLISFLDNTIKPSQGMESIYFKDHYHFEIIIEDIIGNKPTFNKGMIWSAIAANNKARIAMGIGIFDKMAQDVGGNKRDEKHLIEYFERLNYKMHLYAPKKHSKTKMKHAEFVQETGITNRLNEHTRDASMLILHHLSVNL